MSDPLKCNPLTFSVLELWLVSIERESRLGRRRAQLARTAMNALRSGITQTYKLNSPQRVFALGADPFAPDIRKALKGDYSEKTLEAYSRRVAEIIRAWFSADGLPERCPDLLDGVRKYSSRAEGVLPPQLSAPREGIATYDFPARRGKIVRVEVLEDMTADEAARMGEWIRTLVAT